MVAMMTELGPLCECGCGERLPAGSVRKYKRGHRQRVNRAESRAMDKELGIFDGYNFQQYPAPETERIDAWDTVEYQTSPEGAYAFTIADAAEVTPNDPDTDIWANVSPSGKEIPRAIVRDVEGKLAFMLSTTAGMVNIVDPVCGGALLANTKDIAHNLTPVICQSPGIVAWFGKTSNVMLYVNLAMACWPVLAAVYAHHFSKHEEPTPNAFNGDMNINPNMYGVQ